VQRVKEMKYEYNAEDLTRLATTDLIQKLNLTKEQMESYVKGMENKKHRCYLEIRASQYGDSYVKLIFEINGDL
jgi:hypothetical protein